MTDSPIPSPASVLADLESLAQQWEARANKASMGGFDTNATSDTYNICADELRDDVLPRLQALFAQQEQEQQELEEHLATYRRVGEEAARLLQQYLNDKAAADARATHAEAQLAMCQQELARSCADEEMTHQGLERVKAERDALRTQMEDAKAYADKLELRIVTRLAGGG